MQRPKEIKMKKKRMLSKDEEKVLSVKHYISQYAQTI